MNIAQDLPNAFMITAAMAVGFILVGCERKETVLDVDTPNGGVLVERDVDDGDITIDVDKDR